MVLEGVSPIYLDEIGMLELNNKGLHHILLSLLDQSVDLCLVIREDLVEDVIKKYQIKAYEMIGD
jgi:nucleoside-triphosphatase THEP1